MALAYENLVPATYRVDFIEKVKAICLRLGINPDWLMIVMKFETANTFSPSIKNKGSGAVGLIQFTEITQKDLGVTLAQLGAMTAVRQLDYVEKYLTPYKSKISDVYSLYLAVFSPAFLGRPDEQVIYSKSATTELARRRYELNKGLDINKDGVITIWEIKQVIRSHVPITTNSGVLSENKLLPIIGVALLAFFTLKRSN